MPRLARRSLLALILLAAGCGCDDERDGTYGGPRDTVVVVSGGFVTKLELTYSGNAGFEFAGATVKREGMIPIQDDAFTVQTVGATISGRFAGCGKIEGTWQEGAVSGTWSASK